MERNGNTVEIWATATRSHFTPDIMRVKQGDTVILHMTNIEQTKDATHGFAIADYNIQASLEPGETANFEFAADKVGAFNFYCTEFCSALHLEMAGWLLVEPTSRRRSARHVRQRARGDGADGGTPTLGEIRPSGGVASPPEGIPGEEGEMKKLFGKPEPAWLISAVIAGVLLVAAIFVPLWRMELVAPQYPAGLVMHAYGDHFEGDSGLRTTTTSVRSTG